MQRVCYLKHMISSERFVNDRPLTVPLMDTLEYLTPGNMNVVLYRKRPGAAGSPQKFFGQSASLTLERVLDIHLRVIMERSLFHNSYHACLKENVLFTR